MTWNIRLILIGLGVAAIAASYLFVFHKGGEEVRQEIKEQNHESLSNADRGELDYSKCLLPRVYNFGTGKCENPR
jgi:hypothetical protein